MVVVEYYLVIVCTEAATSLIDSLGLLIQPTTYCNKIPNYLIDYNIQALMILE